MVQQRATDVRLFGAGGYALALQLGHPTIAAGVRDHSGFTSDPWGRFFGTVDFVNLLVYGDRDQVTAATRGLRSTHARISGTRNDGKRYSALDPSAFAWVHATLAEAIVRGHQVFGVAFTAYEKEQFWSEWRELGAQMGVRDFDLPTSWPGFREYLRDTIDNVLVYNDMIEVAQRTASDATGGSPLRWLPPAAWAVAGRPLGRYGAFLARGTMGPRLRRKFRIPWSLRDEAVFSAAAAACRAATPVMPAPLRVAGPVALRMRRSRIAAGPFA